MTIDYQFDQDHIWHPYTSLTQPLPTYGVTHASKNQLFLDDGKSLTDGMSSWWAAVHGYNHPKLNQALTQQAEKMSHVMFGGITHQPAIDLCKKLVELTPAGLDKVFLADSGSVGVEVAIKMAIQYWQSQNQTSKTKLLSLRGGYHGDTFAAMSVCDPVNGMHSLFNNVINQHFFVESPTVGFEQTYQHNSTHELEHCLVENSQHIAAIILEPIVQGAGGMKFYHPDYLKHVRQLADKYNVLLIADEIATGFGRTGKLFACEWADISPDILCVGKALTGGYMTLAATLTTQKVADGICNGQAGVFMHGPTFMGNPLACAVANAAIDLLIDNDWQSQVRQIEAWLNQNLKPLADFDAVKNVRVLGAIGVVELHQTVPMAEIQAFFVEQGVWIRPFGKLIYLMPPFISEQSDIIKLADAIKAWLAQ
ncbi:adenosylmethionine--8-amino-7-oxononanoate transaminase [Catenovulum adriaticum]|uniref:Adenosylmethionine-8-amino-7-oxononanoate aminotransferase n=1 Tax=Catenovulum adriaticum TaxID=2984846 RepID=A0ABY7APB0_9ALTE|nr:adenosylmethionine--8-amino-7-oxononanoate transaminase [Catenovulum sp. TS8]WAJ71398.1 adenosylmethionine--8-amino-7-oxononanoate transaminase [Catenovulum sp. TS8]